MQQDSDNGDRPPRRIPSAVGVALALTRELEARLNIHPEIFWDTPSPTASFSEIRPKSVLLTWDEFVQLAEPHLEAIERRR